MNRRQPPLPRITQRVELMLGRRCNANCRFCYFLGTVSGKATADELPTENARALLGAIRRHGMSEVEFTGGEPTLRGDLPELAASARDMGFVNVSLITNGLKLSDPDYAKHLIASGVNDVIFSVHGHTGELHDYQTRVPGSFEKILKAIDNVEALGARVRSNTVINGINCRYAPEILDRLIGLNMAAIYFVLFNPITEAHNAETAVFVRYPEAARHIVRAIERHKDRLPCFSVKYIPFCYLKGYERFVMNCPQQNYDPDEWHIYVSHKLSLSNQGLFRRTLALSRALTHGLRFLRGYGHPLKHGWQGLKTRALTRHVGTLGKVRLRRCLECRYLRVCDYIWGAYLELFGDDDVEPATGPVIDDPVWCYLGAVHRHPGTPVAAASAVRGDRNS